MFEVSLTHAALQTGELVHVRSCLVHVLEHLGLLPEQNVVNGAGDLAVVNEGVGLHVLLPLELHVASGLVAGNAGWTQAALFHVGLD